MSRGDPQGCLQSQPGFPLPPEWNFNDPDRWSFGFPRRETVKTSGALVEFFATNDTPRKLKDDALAFSKGGLMSKNHPREDYKELLRLSYCPGGEGPAKPSAVPEPPSSRWMAKAIYAPSSDVKSPLS
ncbi:hypothetical protein GWK47_036966 [Chionoecetes opilio]|uniref:Uncharacterized protein n=1 Tax=Chionoecetes opilio TaxID=41210 RepID=A0A8J4YE12_CHIOP|nr:hypothetical protein GWK47_036966 [Chionoecetes opilio]